jgi:hypothetical protein
MNDHLNRLPYLKELEATYLSKAEQMHQSEAQLTQAKQELEARLAKVNNNNVSIAHSSCRRRSASG